MKSGTYRFRLSCLSLALLTGPIALSAQPVTPTQGSETTGAPGAKSSDEGQGAKPSNVDIPALRKEGASLSTLPGYSLKVGGQIFTGYEALDHSPAGRPDSTGPTQESAGFSITRAYINLDAKVETGEFKGWGARITGDFGRAANELNGCGSVCSQNNDYVGFLKFAYVNIPLSFLNSLYGTNSIRFGQQGVPFVEVLDKYWDHRYLARTTIEEIGVADSTDRGLSFTHTNKYGGLYLLFGNGEGFRRNNAQEIKRQTAADLAQGAGDSYGIDLYGLLSVIPTGDNRRFHWSVNIPFRLRGIAGIDESESRYISANFQNAPDKFDILYREGDARAKRDVTAGVETDFRIDLGNLLITLGGGSARTNDRRGAVNEVTLTQTVPGALTQSFSHTDNRDANGFANYLFGSVRFHRLEAFGRLIHGTSANGLSNRYSAVNRTPWLAQAVALDLKDDVLGNLRPLDAINGIDLTTGRYDSTIYGVTLYPSEYSSFFRVSLGVSELSGRDRSGREYRTNPFERYDGGGLSTPNSKSIAEQIEANSAIKNQLGLASADSFRLNDLIGKRVDNRQVFLRAELKF